MKTRVISLLLALVMIITAVPAMSVFAFAESSGTEGGESYYDISSLNSYREEDLAKEGVDAESVARVYALTTKTYDRLSAAQRHSVIADVIASIDAESGLRSFIGTDDEATTDVYEDAVAAQLYFDKLAVSKMVIDGSLYEQDGLQFHASFFNAADGDAISASTNWKSFLVNSKDGMSTNFSISAPDKPRLDENGYMVTGNYTKSNGTVVENVIITDPAYEMLQFNSGSLKSLWYGTIVYNPETGEYYKYSDGTTPSKTAPTDSYNAAGADSTTNSGANITFGPSLSSKTDYSYQFVMAYDATAPALSDSSNRIVTQSLQTVNFRVDTGLSKLAGAFKTRVAPAKGTSYDWSFAYYDTSATGNTPIYHGDIFDLTYVDDIDASAGVHTLRVYTGTHLLGQNEKYPLADKTSAGQTFKSSYTDIFAIRVYAKALTVEDITQNHFADLVNYYQLDISGYNTLSKNGKDAVKEELQSISVADKAYTTHDAVQARLDELVIDNFDYDGLRENGTGYAFNHTIDLAKHYKLSVTEYISLDAGARVWSTTACLLLQLKPMQARQLLSPHLMRWWTIFHCLITPLATNVLKDWSLICATTFPLHLHRMR